MGDRNEDHKETSEMRHQKFLQEVRDIVDRADANLGGEPVDLPAEQTAGERSLTRLMAWGVPRRAAENALAALEPNGGTKALEALGGRDRCLLVLNGEPGSGKSCAAARWLLTPPESTVGSQPPRWIQAFDLAAMAPWDEGVKELMAARALVIDDVGAEYSDEKGSVLAKLDAIVDRRYGNILPTVITTNLTAQEMRERLPGRVLSRIREAGDIVTMTTNYRARAR